MKYSVKALMKDNKKNQQECVICGKTFSGYGNSAYPVVSSGRCCDSCEFEVVLPSRLAGNSKKPVVRDSIKDLDALIKSEDEAIALYSSAIDNSGDGIEKGIYEEILADEKDHLAKLNALKEGYAKSERID